MRTIKFRGKSRKTGDWLVGDLLQVANEVFIAPSDGDWFDFIPWPKNNVFHLPSATYEVIPDTVGQFTGLLDRNGEEIYEGDVVVLRRGAKNISNAQAIEWCSHVSAFVRVIDDDAHFISEADMNLYQVVGNIHDNPELLTLNK